MWMTNAGHELRPLEPLRFAHLVERDAMHDSAVHEVADRRVREPAGFEPLVRPERNPGLLTHLLVRELVSQPPDLQPGGLLRHEREPTRARPLDRRRCK